MGEIADRLAGHAPITMRVTKEAIRRLLLAGVPAGDDLARACYGSKDFRIGVEAFVAKRPPEWTESGASCVSRLRCSATRPTNYQLHVVHPRVAVRR